MITAQPITIARGLDFMSDEYDSLKKATDQLIKATDKMQEQLAFLITMHEVGKRDQANVDQTIKRAFRRIEKLEDVMDEVKGKQLSSAWITHFATAAITGTGATIAVIIYNLGDKI